MIAIDDLDECETPNTDRHKCNIYSKADNGDNYSADNRHSC